MTTDADSAEAPPRRGLAAAAWLALGAAVWVLGAGPRDVGGPLLMEFHPLVLPFRSDVVMAPGAWIHAASAWVQLALTLAIAASLRPRSWLIVVAGCFVCTAPVWGAFTPSSPRLVLLLVAAGARWRGWHGLAGLALAGSVLQDTILGSVPIIVYGMTQANLAPLVAVVGVLLAVGVGWLVRQGEAWMPAIPGLLAAADLVLVLAGAEAMEQHHERPPGPGECADVDVRILDPIEDGGRPFLPRGVAVSDDTIAVSGDGGVAVSIAGGPFERLPMPPEAGRVEFVAFHDADVMAAAASAGLIWTHTDAGWQPTLVQPWSPAIPEVLHVASGPMGPLWTTGNYPLVLRPTGDVVYVGGGHHGFVALTTGVGDDLVLSDAWSVSAYEPRSLTPTRSRSWPPWAGAARVNAGPDRLYRMKATAGAVEVLDANTFETLSSFRTDYAARYLAASEDGRWLLLADYFGDRLELRDADGALIAERRGGPRPRNMTWSATRGAFLGVSACGLWQLDPPGQAH